MLVFKNGKERIITGEDGKFWICGDERFRKLGKQIAGVKEEAITAESTPEAKPKPKRKSTKKKKEATEAQADGDVGC